MRSAELAVTSPARLGGLVRLTVAIALCSVLSKMNLRVVPISQK